MVNKHHVKWIALSKQSGQLCHRKWKNLYDLICAIFGETVSNRLKNYEQKNVEVRSKSSESKKTRLPHNHRTEKVDNTWIGSRRMNNRPRFCVETVCRGHSRNETKLPHVRNGTLQCSKRKSRSNTRPWILKNVETSPTIDRLFITSSIVSMGIKWISYKLS